MTTARIELPPKLIPVFSGEADVRGAYGGRGSGKTMSFAKMAAVYAYKRAMEGRQGIILCCRQFMNSLDDSSLEEVKRAIESEPWLEPFFDIGEKYIRTTDGRVAFKFSGLDRNISSVKSKSRILLCWVDEAEPVSDSAWATLIPTLREEDSELWVTWNPERKGSATDERFKKSSDPRYKIVEINWRDNPRFPDKLNRDRLRDQEERPEDYDHVWEGDYKSLVSGAIYGVQLRKAREEGRITRVPIDPICEVHTFWDLGRNDQTAIWFMQKVGQEARFIDYYESRLVGLDHYIKLLKSKGYSYGEHYLPHDVEVTELTSNESRRTMLELGGVKPIVVVPRVSSVNEGIEMTRKAISYCWFDEERCEKGLDALSNYQYVYDEKYDTFRQTPLHNWASNGADAFRQFGQGFRHSVAVTPAISDRRKAAMKRNRSSRYVC